MSTQRGTVRRDRHQDSRNVVAVHADERIDPLATRANVVSAQPQAPANGLEQTTRATMERAIDHDFARVRVHHDEESERAATSLQTRAFTVGSDVYFGRGAYTPQTPQGLSLLAHELTHVAQNERSGDEAGRLTSERGDSSETEAEYAASTAITPGSPRFVPRAAPAATIQREPPAPSTIAAASGQADPNAPAAANAPVAPKAPAPGNDVLTFRGRQFSASPEFTRFQLQKFVAETEKGEDKVRQLVNEFGSTTETLRVEIEQERKNGSTRKQSGGTDVSGAPRDLPAMETEYQTRLRVQPVMKQELDKLVADNATFLRTFETTARKIMLDIMDVSEKRAKQELEHYGIVKGKTLLQGANNKASGDLRAAAKELARKHRELNAARQTLFALEQRKKNADVDPQKSKWVPGDDAILKDATETATRLQMDLQIMQVLHTATFPILAPHADSESGLEELAAHSAGTFAQALGWEISGKLANITTVREGLGTTYTVWGLPKVADITKQQMPGVQGNAYYTRLVDDKVRADKEAKQLTADLLDALQWMFLIFSVIPVTAPIGAVGSAAVGVVNVATAMRDYQIQAAASGTDFDKARAISNESPSEFWLAAQLVMFIPDAMQAVKAFRALAPAARAMKLTGDGTQFAAAARSELPDKADQLIARAEQRGGMSSPLIGPTAGRSGTALSLWREFQENALRAWSRITGQAVPPAGASWTAQNLASATMHYEQLLKLTPSREAAVWYCRSGNYFVVVQGSGNWVGGAVNAPAWAGAWHIVEHYHPERNFAVQFASDIDYNSLLGLWGGRGNIRQRISSTIRYVDPKTGQWHFSYFGYDPHLENTPLGPFFLNIETKGGARLDMSFKDMNEYRSQINRLKAGVEVPQ